MSYFIDHGVPETKQRKSTTGSSNPNISDFMSLEPTSQTYTTLQAFAALQAARSHANHAHYTPDSVLDDLITQLMDEAQHNAKGTPPASLAFVRNLALVDDKGDCAICIDSITQGLKLPCGHYFHEACLAPWLKLHNSCPVCRQEYPTDDVEYEKKKRAEKIEYEKVSDDEEPWDPFFG